jgi:hypothetical protein
MAKFRKKPVVIDAVQFTGQNLDEVMDFMVPAVPMIRSALSDSDEDDNIQSLGINTLEGTMTADINDWIIRGVKGEYYPCKPDVFAATYDPV